MTVTGDHAATGPEVLGPPSYRHPTLWPVRHLGVFRCFSTIAINSLYGPNKMQLLEEPKEKYEQKTKTVQRLHAPVSSSSFFQGEDFSHFMCMVLFI